MVGRATGLKRGGSHTEDGSTGPELRNPFAAIHRMRAVHRALHTYANYL